MSMLVLWPEIFTDRNKGEKSQKQAEKVLESSWIIWSESKFKAD